jgi:hypothetical protein
LGTAETANFNFGGVNPMDVQCASDSLHGVGDEQGKLQWLSEMTRIQMGPFIVPSALPVAFSAGGRDCAETYLWSVIDSVQRKQKVKYPNEPEDIQEGKQ